MLGNGGAAPGDGCVHDMPLPWWTAGRTSHDGEVAEQGEGGRDVPGERVLTLEHARGSSEAEEVEGGGNLAGTTTASGGQRWREPSD